jgi:hypothetical protein
MGANNEEISCTIALFGFLNALLARWTVIEG